MRCRRFVRGAPPVNRFVALLLLALVLAPAVFLRTFRLGTVPGLNGDEAVHGFWARQIVEQGDRPLFSPDSRHVNRLDGTVHLEMAVPHYAPWLLYAVAGTFRAAGASIASLRGIGVAANLLSLLAWFFLLRRAFGPVEAYLGTLALGLMPFHVANSRFATQVVLVPPLLTAALACLERFHGTRRAGWLIGAALALGSAAGQHAIALVSLPIGLGAVLWWGRGQALARRPATWAALGVLALLLTPQIPVLVELVEDLLGGRAGAPLSLAAVAGRGFHPVQAFGIELLVIEGGQVYQSMAGVALAPDGPLRIVAGVILIALTGGGFWWIARSGSAGARLIAAHGAIHLIVPLFLGVVWDVGQERYLVCMLPSLIVSPLAGAVALVRGLRRTSRALSVGAAILAGLPLASWTDGLARHYFGELIVRGGQGPCAQRSAAEEVKVTATALLGELLDGNQPGGWPGPVFAADWWVYWPLRFLAPLDAPIWSTAAMPQQLAAGLPDCFALVTFAEGREEAKARDLAAKLQRTPGVEMVTRTIPAADGRPLVVIRLVRSRNASPRCRLRP